MYEKNRPSKKVLEAMFVWLQAQGINMYAQCCDAEAGIQYPSLMDIKNADQIIQIYDHNKADDWVEQGELYK